MVGLSRGQRRLRSSSIAFLRHVLLWLVPLLGLGLQVLRLGREGWGLWLLVVVRLLALLAVTTHTLLSILRWHLLLWVLQASQGPGSPALHAKGVALCSWGTIGASWVWTALLRLGVGVGAHPIQLRSLHHHWVHGTALSLSGPARRAGAERAGATIIRFSPRALRTRKTRPGLGPRRRRRARPDGSGGPRPPALSAWSCSVPRASGLLANPRSCVCFHV